MKFATAISCLATILSVVALANAQTDNSRYAALTGHCEGPVYSGNQIPGESRAKLRSRTAPTMTKQSLTDGVHGTVVIEAVLCRNGQITDLRVLQDLPDGLTEEAIRSVLGIEFTPAVVGLHSVSQKMRFEFSFNDRQSGVISSKDAEGKLISTLEVIGNRRLDHREILNHIKTRPGDIYSDAQAKQDLESLLSTGYFDPGGTSLSTEIGPRDEIIVILQVQELPLISDVRFQGLTKTTDSEIFDALRQRDIQLQSGAIYNPQRVKVVTEIIRDLLVRHGDKDVNVETKTEFVSLDRVVLTFVISHP
jgi:hypothetical protein